MTKKSWRIRTGEEIPVLPQRFKWKKISIYDAFEEADKQRNTLRDDSHELTKIRRCGPDGVRFKVLIGEPIEKKGKKKGEKR